MSRAAEDIAWALSDPNLAGRFSTILADPPWQFKTWSHRGEGRGAVQHYPTMPTKDICALPVANVAADNCVLFLWGTWPHLPDALATIAAWGFEYKTCGFVWVKQDMGRVTLWADVEDLFLGLGYGTRGNTEFCLRAARGAPKVKPKSRDVPQIIMAARRQHSRKPDEQYERIEKLYGGPYLELFARMARSGWHSLGNQVGKFPAAAAAAAE